MHQSQLTRIIAGTMHWGSWGKNYSAHQVANLIASCVDSGISTFDTADIYGDYTNDTLLHAAFIHSGINRHSYKLVGKAGVVLPSYASNCSKTLYYNNSKTHLTASLNKSLQSLGTEYFDVFLVHRPDALLNPEEIAAFAEEAITSGKINSFGISNFQPQEIDLLRPYITPHWCQSELSLFKPELFFNGTSSYFQKHNIQFMSWGSLGSKQIKNTNHTVFESLREKYGPYSNAAFSIAWLLQHPLHVHAVVGASTIEHYTEALVGNSIALEKEDWYALLNAFHKIIV